MAAPKLRFKAFIKPYKNIKYEEFAPLQRGFDLPVSTIVDGEYPVVFSNGILKKHNSFKAKAPGVVTGRSGTIGNITWVDKDYWPHNTSLWVTNFFDNDPRYTFYFLQDFDVSRFASGSGVPTLNRNDVHAQLIHIPTDRNEQSKIATFLSAVDEKITQLTQKHQLLSQYKQGMMQKLFSQQIRFKADDGSDFGDWEEKILSQLFDYANGKSFEADVMENGKFKLITLNSIDIKGNLKKAHKTVENSDNSLIENDLIMILSDVAYGDFLGLTAIIPDNSYVLNQRVGRLRSKIDLNIYYMRFYINYNQKYFKLKGQGSSQLNLSKADILNFSINLPCLAEQTKIANFLSAIDQKIDVVSEQLEQAKLWKKGLLQQMFV